MATQAIEQVPQADEQVAAPNMAKRLTLILGLVGVAAGIAVGLFALGPVIAKRRDAFSVSKRAGVPSTSVTHPVENLVLNPAGSSGTRFLMVTATFELRDASANQVMLDHEAEIRDRILSLLGKKTVEELTDMTQRELIKQQVLDAVAPVFPKGAVTKVFFPQFVIQ